MLLPSIFGESLLDDWMDFPNLEIPDIDKKLYGKHAAHVMKTDVHEDDKEYEVDIDLPGFKKDEIKLSLENGYLSVGAVQRYPKIQAKRISNYSILIIQRNPVRRNQNAQFFCSMRNNALAYAQFLCYNLCINQQTL